MCSYFQVRIQCCYLGACCVRVRVKVYAGRKSATHIFPGPASARSGTLLPLVAAVCLFGNRKKAARRATDVSKLAHQQRWVVAPVLKAKAKVAQPCPMRMSKHTTTITYKCDFICLQFGTRQPGDSSHRAVRSCTFFRLAEAFKSHWTLSARPQHQASFFYAVAGERSPGTCVSRWGLIATGALVLMP